MRYYYGIIFKEERIMKIKKWLGVAALATVAGLALAACENSEKKSDNETVVKIATVNRSGSEEARWDKIQELKIGRAHV